MRRSIKRHKVRIEYKNIYSVIQSLKCDDFQSLQGEIEKGYDPEYGDGQLSLVHYCVIYESSKCLNYLLEEIKISPNQFDTSSRGTPLHLAISQNKIEIAKILVNSGADLCTANFNGASPINLLENQNSDDWQVVLDLAKEKIIKSIWDRQKAFIYLRLCFKTSLV
ncbi:unnamed protein product [Blepharisma stoltei]|uniref:Ankyrin repeat protein n=1 Tax=Blepharisma stoltei TaxID=1481888 RepID=A0AAU9JT59_9CILI|nr:unnamed protein product [Blepharisma stoltei]